MRYLATIILIVLVVVLFYVLLKHKRQEQVVIVKNKVDTVKVVKIDTLKIFKKALVRDTIVIIGRDTSFRVSSLDTLFEDSSRLMVKYYYPSDYFDISFNRRNLFTTIRESVLVPVVVDKSNDNDYISVKDIVFFLAGVLFRTLLN